MEAAKLLRDFLGEPGSGKHKKFASDVRVSRLSVWAWVNGRSVPGEALKVDIEKATGGAVPASAWPVTDRRKPQEPAA